MKKRLPFILLVLISTFIVLFFYHDVVFHPNNYLFNHEGDAIKNYFTYCFHIKHDTSYINFEGMNYPFGEHFLYTDCHPVIASFLKLLSGIWPILNDYSIGILNFLMILSVFLTFFVCYLLLREFKINLWLSLLFSIGMTLLAPQIFRMGGHLALSYSVAIPLSWLLMIRCLKRENNTFYMVILFLNNLFWLFIHSYLGIIIIFFLSMIVLVQFLTDKNKWVGLKKHILLFTVVCLPIIMFYAFATLTDTHTGRTNNPSGFFQYTAELDDIFLPNHAPLKPLLDQLTGNIIKQQWEAWSYVGFSTTILFIVLIVLYIMRFFKRSKSSFLNELFHSTILKHSLIAAFLVLLFAMAVPFKQIDHLIDYLPILKQFRATGRFAWPFYFVALVFSASVMQHIYNRLEIQNKKISAILICLLVGGFNIMEGIPYHIENSASITKSGNVFKKDLLQTSYTNALKAINASDYQAIIALPFFYQGSECFTRPRNYKTVSSSFILSYHTGIPIVCANLTRTSVDESKKIVQIVSPGFYTKEIQHDIKSTKPFLVIKTNDSITEYEKEILQKCKPLYISDEISVYSLQTEDLFHNNSVEVFEKYQSIKHTLSGNHSFQVSTYSTFLYYNGFEGSSSEQVFRGTAGFQSSKKGQNIFAQFAPYTFENGKKYHVSLWMYNGMANALNDWLRFIIEEYDEETNTWESTTYFPEQSETINGNWSLMEGTFEIKNPKHKIFITTKGQDNAKEALFVDDLLIKEVGTDVFKVIGQNELFYNNHQVLK